MSYSWTIFIEEMNFPLFTKSITHSYFISVFWTGELELLPDWQIVGLSRLQSQRRQIQTALT